MLTDFPAASAYPMGSRVPSGAADLPEGNPMIPIALLLLAAAVFFRVVSEGSTGNRGGS